jgi:hypothetical protein
MENELLRLDSVCQVPTGRVAAIERTRGHLINEPDAGFQVVNQ